MHQSEIELVHIECLWYPSSMSIARQIAKRAKAKLAAGSKVALKNAGEAFNRLDELGGEARDTLVTWWQQSPAMGTVRDMLEKRAAKSRPTSEEDDDLEESITEAELVVESCGDATIAVQVYGKRSCPWSGRAVRLLEDRDIEHVFVELDDSENASIPGRLVAETKQNSVPYIFVRGEFVGGFNALDELDRLGQLEARIATGAGESSGPIKVEVAKRPNTDEVAPGDLNSPSDN